MNFDLNKLTNANPMDILDQNQISQMSEIFNEALMNDWLYDSNDNSVKLLVKMINNSNNPDPTYQKEGDSGFDLAAFIPEDITLKPFERLLIPTGLFYQIPLGFELQIRPRSGLAFKNGITVLNSPGTVDCVPGNTRITTPNGDLFMEDIFNNNIKEIISFNEENFITEVDYIEDMWIIDGVECLKIETEGGEITIPYTKEVYCKRGWVMAKDLLISDEILSLT